VIKDVSTGSPFPGNVIPNSLQNSVGKNYLNAFPTPNISGKVQQNYVSQRQQTQKFNDFDVRGDWNARETDRVFGRYSYAHDKEDTTTRLPGLPAGFGSGEQFTYAHGAAAGHTHTFSPTLYSDLRLGFQRTKLGYAPPYADEPLSKNLGIPNANTSSLLGGGALIGGWNSQLEYTGDYGNYQVPENTYQVVGSLSWAKGAHLVKFGGNFIRREVNSSGPRPQGATSSCGATASVQARRDMKPPTSSPVSSTIIRSALKRACSEPVRGRTLYSFRTTGASAAGSP
jgi:hypothetical protein